MILGVEHFALASATPHQLAEWYVANLDFTLFSTSPGADFIQARNGALIEIVTAKRQMPEPELKDSGMRHIAIAVDDFNEAYLRLKNAGVSFATEPSEANGNKLAFFKDPEGNFIHLIHRTKALI